jgi:alpha-galactosidase
MYRSATFLIKKSLVLPLLLLCVGLFAQKKNVAPTPPMGWNSYNCFGATVQESEVKANADYMATRLKTHGWQYVVVDFCWSYPHPPGSTQSPPPQFRTVMDNAPVPWLGMDEYGRLLPDLRKFPASKDGAGFKTLADYVHGLGLKFGIHIMRGIPRQAVWAKSKVLKTKGITADQIVDTMSVCPWNNNMWGVDMSKPGAQEYYNSLFDLYAAWGVDFVKMDDVDGDPGYPYRSAEVEAVRKAIDQCGRPMVLSLSLNLKYEHREHLAANAEMWRISMDFWDNWAQLEKQFDHCAQWQGFAQPNAFPDADMLQIGRLSKRGPVGAPRWSLLTNDEILTHFTLWTIFRSPLMMGGDMTDNTPFIEELLTNDEVIAVNQQGFEARQVFKKDETCAWVSKSKGSSDLNLAFFNLSNTPKEVAVSLADLGLSGTWQVRDLWKKNDLGLAKNTVSQMVNPHGARLFKISKKN